MYSNRSPFYSLLKTHFDLYGFPLEADLFAAKAISDRDGKTDSALALAMSLVGGDDLPVVQFLEHSSNVTVDQKKRTVKFSKIHRSGNWVWIDMGSPCLLTDIHLTLKGNHNNSTYSSITGQITIDSYKKYQVQAER